MNKESESIKSFNLPFISDVEVLSGQHIVNEFRRHIHKTYIIGVVVRGKRIITHHEGSNQISENEAFILNPGQVHSCSSLNQTRHSYKILSISSHTMQVIASEISGKPEKQPFFKKIHYKNEVLANKIIQLFDVINDPESDVHVESNLYSFLTYLIMSFSETSPLIYITGEQKDSIKRVCDYIRKKGVDFIFGHTKHVYRKIMRKNVAQFGNAYMHSYNALPKGAKCQLILIRRNRQVKSIGGTGMK